MTRTFKLLFTSLTLAGVACAPYVLREREDAGVEEDAGENPTGLLPDGGLLDGGGGGPPPDAGFEVCLDQGRKVELSPLDLLVVLDISYSMDYDEKWTAVKSAMKSFVARPEFTGLGVGLQYFPLRTQCSVEAYKAPAVGIGVLPAVGGVIANSLDLQQMSGGTPTVQALEGALFYAKGWLSGHPTRKTAIVLATDGVPDGTCAGVASGGLSNSLANVRMVASSGAASSPQVKTFVIGVGKDLSALNDIAVSGGTKAALFVDNTPNADVAFLNALTGIRLAALGCDFSIPVIAVQDRAQVSFAPDDGSPTLHFSQVTDKAACSGGQGWYLDATAKQIVLCDATCEAVTQQKTGFLHVEFTCGIN